MKDKAVLLSEIQNKFKTELLSPTLSDDGALDHIFESDDIPVSERLGIYRNNVIGSLIEVMSANYPLIKTLVGEDFFQGVAKRFITAHPPSGGCLNEYGGDFSDFLNKFEPAQSLSYLPDIAQYEWARQLAYYARDDQALKAEELASVAAENLNDLVLALRDNIQLVSSRYPLLAIEAFCEKSDDGGATLDLDQGGVALMIARPHLKLEVHELDDASFAMLAALDNGQPLGTAVEQTLGAHEDFDFQAFLQTHIALETFLTLQTNI